MRDVHVYLFETVANYIKFERVKYNKSKFWPSYIYNIKVSFNLFFINF